jgi:hypothetical protein
VRRAAEPHTRRPDFDGSQSFVFYCQRRLTAGVVRTRFERRRAAENGHLAARPLASVMLRFKRASRRHAPVMTDADRAGSSAREPCAA